VITRASMWIISFLTFFRYKSRFVPCSIKRNGLQLLSSVWSSFCMVIHSYSGRHLACFLQLKWSYVSSFRFEETVFSHHSTFSWVINAGPRVASPSESTFYSRNDSHNLPEIDDAQTCEPWNGIYTFIIIHPNFLGPSYLQHRVSEMESTFN
jgi:hypothetical protein